MSAGYSGTPLAKKLSLKPGIRLRFDAMPSSSVPTDITEDPIPNSILPDTDWVDVKVCAIDATWSGFAPIIRKSVR